MNNDKRLACDFAAVKTCAECSRPLGGYERAFYQIYRGRCVACHEKLMLPAWCEAARESEGDDLAPISYGTRGA